MPISDYQRIERAIRYLQVNFRQQPSLEELAAGLPQEAILLGGSRWAPREQFLAHDAPRRSACEAAFLTASSLSSAIRSRSWRASGVGMRATA